MKKGIIIFFIILIIGIAFFLLNNQKINVSNKSQNYVVSKVSKEVEENKMKENEFQKSENQEIVKEPVEVEIASYSTSLASRYSSSKHNISIACDRLNETIVESGEVFSFWDSIGDTTKDLGYVAADSFDEDGDTIKTYGGGVCQLSSTLYNAVLDVPQALEVVERHPHSKKVEYVEEGKDATVSYSSVDFKFKNLTPNQIKVYAECTDTEVIIRIKEIK